METQRYGPTHTRDGWPRAVWVKSVCALSFEIYNFYWESKKRSYQAGMIGRQGRGEVFIVFAGD